MARTPAKMGPPPRGPVSSSSPLTSLGSSPSPPASRASSSSSLSMASRSPTPPPGYPSPSLTGSRSSSNTPPVFGPLSRDGPPPSKKRRLSEFKAKAPKAPRGPKERTTEYLDLGRLVHRETEEDSNDEVQLQRLLKELRTKKKIVVVAGAGISVAAGIPDFRSATGLFKTLPGQHKLKSSGQQLFDASVYKNDDSTASFHAMVRDLSKMSRNAKPTAFHHMIATLAEEGRLLRLYSQNVDGIDTSLQPLATNIPLNERGPWPKTILLHGGLEKMVCSKCSELFDFDGSLFEGPEAPLCTTCDELDRVRTEIANRRSQGVGRLRPRMVLYNEHNPDEEAIGRVSCADLKARPDAVIVVGTSLKVPGIRRIVKEMCKVTRDRRDGFTAWVNLDPEPVGVEFKDCWDVVVKGDCQDLARFAHLPKWDDKDIGAYDHVSDEDIEKAKTTKLEVVLESKSTVESAKKDKAVSSKQGILTPTASPRHSSPAVVASGDLKVKQPQLNFIRTSKLKGEVQSDSDSTKENPKKKPGRPTKSPAAKGKPTGVVKKRATAKPKQGPGRPPKAAATSNPITAFTTTKKTTVAASKSTEKLSLGTPPSSQAEEDPAPLKAFNMRNGTIKVWSSAVLRSRTGTPHAEAPTPPPKTRSSRGETISPSSVPHGMEALLS